MLLGGINDKLKCSPADTNLSGDRNNHRNYAKAGNSFTYIAQLALK
jgi:hypothetical protein